jgi:hypothetical protein
MATRNPPKQRALHAALLLRVGEIVSVDQLLDDLPSWLGWLPRLEGEPEPRAETPPTPTAPALGPVG